MARNIIKPMTETQKAWLAAAIDGEGCIELQQYKRRSGKRNTNRVAIVVTNTEYTFVEEAMRIAGCGKIYCQKREGCKPKYIWIILKPNLVENILKQVYKYLVIKGNKANNTLTYILYRRMKGKGTRGGIVDRTFAEGTQTEIKKLLELL